MTAAEQGRRGPDLAGGIVRPAVVFGLPTVAILLSGPGGFPGQVLTIVWPVAFLWLGIACLNNAWRCGRVHCWFTGPFFLILSILSLLHGTEIFYLGSEGWNVLGGSFAIGGTFLYFIPERIWGRYFRVESTRPGRVDKLPG